MPRIFVHDFKFEYSELENGTDSNDFFCGVTVYFNFSKEKPGEGWDELEYFYISVATPLGFANYIQRSIAQGLYPKIFFFPHLLIVNDSNEDSIISHIKAELHSIFGKTENELILKAMRKFDWESENLPDVYEKLF